MPNRSKKEITYKECCILVTEVEKLALAMTNNETHFGDMCFDVVSYREDRRGSRLMKVLRQQAFSSGLLVGFLSIAPLATFENVLGYEKIAEQRRLNQLKNSSRTSTILPFKAP